MKSLHIFLFSFASFISCQIGEAGEILAFDPPNKPPVSSMLPTKNPQQSEILPFSDPLSKKSDTESAGKTSEEAEASLGLIDYNPSYEQAMQYKQEAYEYMIAGGEKNLLKALELELKFFGNSVTIPAIISLGKKVEKNPVFDEEIIKSIQSVCADLKNSTFFIKEENNEGVQILLEEKIYAIRRIIIFLARLKIPESILSLWQRIEQKLAE